MRKGILVVAVALLALSLLVSAKVALASPAYTVTLRVIDPDNDPLASATVEVFYESGSKVAEGTTNSTGYFEFEVLSNGTYVVVVSKEFYAMDTFEVSGADVSKTMNLTGFYKADIGSTPITVAFNISLTDEPDVVYQPTTNVTFYLPAGESIELAFPEEKTEYYVYKYKLDKIKYDYSETTENTVTLTMNTDKQVTAYYVKTFAITLEYWVVGILVVIIIVALLVAWRAGATTAREMIEEYREKTRKFVHKK